MTLHPAAPPILVAVALLALAGPDCSGEDLIRNGRFTDSLSAWDGAVADDAREVAVRSVAGAPALVLTRKQKAAEAGVQQYNLHLKPLTLYRLTVVGHGDAAAAIRLGPSASSDGEYAKQCKAWATCSSPLPPSTEDRSESFVFDSGRIADGAYLSLRLDGEEPGSHVITRAACEVIGSSAADPKQTVVVHLGDSITITSYLPFSQRVEALLAPLIGKRVPKSQVRQLNLGADGETVAELLDQRYEHAVHAMYPQLDVAVIRYGANDHRSRTPEAFRADLATLCDRLGKDYPGVRIVLGTGPRVVGHDDVNAQYAAYWQAIRDLAKERHYALADIDAAFATAASPDTARAPGDLHPSAAGVAIAAQAELAALAPLLPQR